MNLNEELRSCLDFLADSEIERARHKVFTYAMENLNAEFENEELDFSSPKSNVQRKWIYLLDSF